MTQEKTVCQSCQKEFAIEPEDIDFYKKIEVPPPTWCPECRAVRRMAFWNEHNLYRKKDALTGKEVFSTYPEHSPIKIYDHDYWWSDKWDSMGYGRDYDPKRPFFEQIRDLLYAVPNSSREIKNLTDSDYSNNSSQLKHCYLCFDADFCDNCLYGNFFRDAKDTLDVTNANSLELCYEIFHSLHCYRCFFSADLTNCRDVWFSRDCEDCESCFGCANLRHKKYHIWNESYTKTEYEKKLKELNLGSYAGLQAARERARALWRSLPNRFMHGTHNTNVTGDYIGHSKDVRSSFEIYGSQRIAYSQRVVNGTSDTLDLTSWGDNSELIYESLVCGENNRNLKFCMFCWPACQDLEYCISCHSSQNLFGCVGLRKKEYCVLNKQYTRGDYEALVEKIKIKMLKDGEYGEFFPVSMSPLAYNETTAIDYFPLTKSEARKKGFVWSDPEKHTYAISLPHDRIPDHIRDVPDKVIADIISCASGKDCMGSGVYRVLPRELEFYRRFNLPLPRLCPACRLRERFRFRNPMKLYSRKCSKCGVAITTTYPPRLARESGEADAPDRPEIVYCEECYQNEVV